MSTPRKDISPYAVGPLIFTGQLGVFMVPYEIGALMDGRGLSAGASGLLGTAELAAMSLTSILIVPATRRIALHRLTIAGLVLAGLGEISTAAARPLWGIGFVRTMTGIGCGLVLAATSTSVARSTNPNRVMGLGQMFANLLFLAVFVLTPRVLLKFGFIGFFISLGIYVAASASTIPHISRLQSGDRPSFRAGGRATLGGIKVGALALGLLSLNVGLGAMWSFAERIGREIGLDAEQVGSVLAVSSIAMIAGSATAGCMGDRFGDRWPLLIGSVACGLACYATTISAGLPGYAAGLFLFNFCYLMLGPFALAGVPSALDPSGRLAAAASGIMWLSYSAGVAAGGLIADRASVKAIGLFALCGCVLAAGAFFYAATTMRKGSPASTTSDLT